MPLPKPSVVSFWERVVKQPGDGCWIWSGGRLKKGYGKFKQSLRETPLGDERDTLAHRFSYLLHYGLIPAGLQVCHTCDNPPCVRPDHLFLGTNAQNVADMVSKGRVSKGESHYAKRLSGEAKGVIRQRLLESQPGPRIPRLSEEDVLAIRRRYSGRVSTGSTIQEYGITRKTYWNIVNGILWPDLPVPQRIGRWSSRPKAGSL